MLQVPSAERRARRRPCPAAHTSPWYIVIAHQYGESPLRAEIFNVGSGENISVKELADMISPAQVHVEGRKGDSAATLADISRIKAALGWSPQVSFAEGLKELKALIK